MLLQSLRVLCKAPGGSGSIYKYIEALVRSPGVSGRIACRFWNDLHCADEMQQQAIYPKRRLSCNNCQISKATHIQRECGIRYGAIAERYNVTIGRRQA